MSGFNAKIRYLVSKNVVTDLKCKLADKLKAKEYINNLNLNLINIPNVIQIMGKKIDYYYDFSHYQYPLVIKCNHGCNFNKIFDKPLDINRKELDQLNNFINCNFTKWHKEYQYSKIHRLIYLEEFIDIKYMHQFYCFHGKPLYMEKNYRDHVNKIKYLNQYDINYNKFLFRKSNCYNYDLTPKQKFDDELLECTKIICKDFDFVRVDYYIDNNDKVWFSELTFSPSAGYFKFRNYKIDVLFGKLL